MSHNTHLNNSNKRLIGSKGIFIAAILLISSTLLTVWLSGLGLHRSLIKNALIATIIISGSCFLFFSISLYNGFKLKDNLGKISSRFKWEKFSKWPDWGVSGGSGGSSGNSHIHGFGESMLEVIGAIIIGIVTILLLVFLLWLFGNLIWAFGIFITAALYWIFFRAIRFVLRHSPHCKGSFWKSISHALAYTVLYSATFYLLLLVPYFLRR